MRTPQIAGSDSITIPKKIQHEGLVVGSKRAEEGVKKRKKRQRAWWREEQLAKELQQTMHFFAENVFSSLRSSSPSSILRWGGMGWENLSSHISHSAREEVLLPHRLRSFVARLCTPVFTSTSW